VRVPPTLEERVAEVKNVVLMGSSGELGALRDEVTTSLNVLETDIDDAYCALWSARRDVDANIDLVRQSVDVAVAGVGNVRGALAASNALAEQRHTELRSDVVTMLERTDSAFVSRFERVERFVRDLDADVAKRLARIDDVLADVSEQVDDNTKHTASVSVGTTHTIDKLEMAHEALSARVNEAVDQLTAENLSARVNCYAWRERRLSHFSIRRHEACVQPAVQPEPKHCSHANPAWCLASVENESGLRIGRGQRRERISLLDEQVAALISAHDEALLNARSAELRMDAFVAEQRGHVRVRRAPLVSGVLAVLVAALTAIGTMALLQLDALPQPRYLVPARALLAWLRSLCVLSSRSCSACGCRSCVSLKRVLASLPCACSAWCLHVDTSAPSGRSPTRAGAPFD
jgi:hypothetical protein